MSCLKIWSNLKIYTQQFANKPKSSQTWATLVHENYPYILCYRSDLEQLESYPSYSLLRDLVQQMHIGMIPVQSLLDSAW